MDNIEQMEDERYQNALMALTDAAQCGCTIETLQTIRFECAIFKHDYDAVIQAVLKSKFNPAAMFAEKPEFPSIKRVGER